MHPLLLMICGLALAEPEVPADGGATDEPTSVEPDEATDAPPEGIELPSNPDLPSALDDPSPVSLPGEDGGLASVLGHWKDQERTVWNGTTFVRPTLGLIVHERVKPVTLGFQVGRRWWQLTDGPRLGVQIQGTGDFALAGGKGSYDLGVAALGGPWVSVLGLQVGPGFGGNRWQLGRDELSPAAGVDAIAMLVADLKLVHLYAGAAPRWLVVGERPSATINPLGLGDELSLQAGGALSLGALRLGVGWTRRFTAIEPFDRYHLNVRFLLL